MELFIIGILLVIISTISLFYKSGIVSTQRLIFSLVFLTCALTVVTYTFTVGLPEWVPMSESWNNTLRNVKG